MKSTKGNSGEAFELLYYTFKDQIWVVAGEITVNEKKNRIKHRKMKAYLLFLLGSTMVLCGGLFLLIAMSNMERYGFLCGGFCSTGMACWFIELLEYAEYKQREGES